MAANPEGLLKESYKECEEKKRERKEEENEKEDSADETQPNVEGDCATNEWHGHLKPNGEAANSQGDSPWGFKTQL